MKRPNFFIIGAPKCGTTSLANWLREHPRAFLSTPKEPCFFNTDAGPRNILSIEEYEKLFRSADSQHHAVGEASTFYLLSESAVKGLLDYQPEAKIIVMLRNPLEMVQSLHNQELRGLQETIEDFEEAWAAQERRRAGEDIPERCVHPDILKYYERAQIGTQLARVMEVVPEGQLKTVLFDDLCEDPVRVYREVLDFLGLEYDGRKDFSRTNTRGVLRSLALRRAFFAVGAIKRLLGIRASTGFFSRLAQWNLRPVADMPISRSLQQELEQTFRPEIMLVGEALGRDLSHWLQFYSAKPERSTLSAD